jgi:RNA polymerase sigma-70 factor (ECF subfamily)
MKSALTAPPPEALSETETIQRAQAGDLRAFELLYSTHKKRVFAICLHMAGSRALAEEFTQDVFLNAFRRIHSFRGASAFSSWLYRIAVNVVLGDFRRQKRRPEVDLEAATDSEDGNYDDVLSRYGNYASFDPVLRISLQRGIALLPKGYRLVFQLHDVEGYAHEEIAQMLGCTVGNTKSQLHKARLALRRYLLREARRHRLLSDQRERNSARPLAPLGAGV